MFRDGQHWVCWMWTSGIQNLSLVPHFRKSVGCCPFLDCLTADCLVKSRMKRSLFPQPLGHTSNEVRCRSEIIYDSVFLGKRTLSITKADRDVFVGIATVAMPWSLLQPLYLACRISSRYSSSSMVCCEQPFSWWLNIFLITDACIPYFSWFPLTLLRQPFFESKSK